MNQEKIERTQPELTAFNGGERFHTFNIEKLTWEVFKIHFGEPPDFLEYY
tara:strand:+ start:86 stop:235 length:150 start_codon:yes stop_codon:yes gene_type:complete